MNESKPEKSKYPVNVPCTSYPMKAELAKREPLLIESWRRQNIYRLWDEKNLHGQKYVLHDGPPYANGPIHLGHSLNKILKDFIVKYKAMSGFNVTYIPGWDCHGLPIEYQLMKELGVNKRTIDRLEFRNKAKEFAYKYVNLQRDQFQRLGIFGDWDNPYLTMSPEYEASIISTFGKLVAGGYIYQRKKPVYWCISCETALAEAEIEYQNHTSPSIYVKFPVLKNPPGLELNSPFDQSQSSEHLSGAKDEDVSVLIWTTTPWTLPANVAVAFHPDYEYAIVKCEWEKGTYETLILAKNLVEKVMSELCSEPLLGVNPTETTSAAPNRPFHNYRIIATFTGRQLEGIRCKHPVLDKESVGVLAEFVSLDEGTGIVHIAPGHGEEDYTLSNKYNLPVISPVDDRGRFTADVPDYTGQQVFAANDTIIANLTERKILIHSGKIQHQYPHCWRCKKPIIFRATDQWFLNIDHNELRNKMVDSTRQVTWVPEYGINRIIGMLTVRPDWCLSRQRYWGTPIPVLYCKECHTPVLNANMIFRIANKIHQSGSDWWYTASIEELIAPERGALHLDSKSSEGLSAPIPSNSSTPLSKVVNSPWLSSTPSPIKGEGVVSNPLPSAGEEKGEGVKCIHCGSTEFRKETDILDVWFDSGVSHEAVLKNTARHAGYPADLYLEGSDQHRGWFQTSLIPAVAIDGHPPYRTVLTHGFVLDGLGRAMHKSLGNVISPQEVINKYGAELVRLWVAASDYRDDVRISPEILDQLADMYRKIRNTMRYLLGNLADFNPTLDTVEYKDLWEIDRYILHLTQSLVTEVTSAYDRFEFNRTLRTIYEFCYTELSSFYFDILKDRLYTFEKTGVPRRAAQTVLYELITTIVPLLAPLLSFTAEETWSYLKKEVPGCDTLPDSVFLTGIPKPKSQYLNYELDKIWSKLIALRSLVNTELEQARKQGELGSSLAAKLIFTVPTEDYEFMNDYALQLPMLCIVSQVEISRDDLKINSGQALGRSKELTGEKTGISVRVVKADGTKCVRCWNYSTTVGKNTTYPDLCDRCRTAIK